MMDWAEISEEKKYTDTQGNKLTLHQMVCTEPMWTKNRLLRLQKELEALQAENRNLKATAKIAVQAGESLQKELEAVKDDADTWRRVSESLQLDVKSLKELAINAANQLELYHPESDIPDQLEELL